MNMEISEKQNSPESKKLNVDYSNVNLSVNAQFIINYRKRWMLKNKLPSFSLPPRGS